MAKTRYRIDSQVFFFPFCWESGLGICLRNKPLCSVYSLNFILIAPKLSSASAQLKHYPDGQTPVIGFAIKNQQQLCDVEFCHISHLEVDDNEHLGQAWEIRVSPDPHFTTYAFLVFCFGSDHF